MAQGNVSLISSVAVGRLRKLSVEVQTRRYRLAARIQSIHEMLEYLDDSEVRDPAFDSRRNVLVEDLRRQDRSMQELERLVVAITRITEVCDPADLAIAVEEILSALIGCESYVLFATTSVEPAQVVASCGVSSRVVDSIIAQGCEPPYSFSHVYAQPVMNGTQVVGRLVLLELLPQKGKLLSNDLSLLECMSSAIGVLVAEFFPQMNGALL